MNYSELIALDLPPLLSAVFAALASALIGNFLVLRRLSLMGDAISHSVLPGIVVAFLLTNSRATLPVFLGATAAAVLCTFVTEVIHRYGRIELGASMGVVFSIFFASGILLMEQAAARSVDLDTDCLLHGQLESIFWYPPTELADFLSWSTLGQLPEEVVTSFITMLITIVMIVVGYKELKVSTFDPAHAKSLGLPTGLLNQVVMTIVAFSVVASFKIVGSILVIAMIVCPPATARLLTDRLATQLWLSALVALVATATGYVLAAFGPGWFGFQNSVNAAGMMAVCSGFLLGSAVVAAPEHGLIAKAIKHRRLAISVRSEDILAWLFRLEEKNASETPPQETKHIRDVARTTLLEAFYDRNLTDSALDKLLRAKDLEISSTEQKNDGETLRLSASGLQKAQALVRTHRLWETYLVEELGLDADHVHPTAEIVEHVTKPGLLKRIAETSGLPQVDPHGRKIPKMP